MMKPPGFDLGRSRKVQMGVQDANTMSGSAGSALSSISSTVGGTLSDLTGESALANSIGRVGNAQLQQQQNDRATAMQTAAPTALQMQQLQSAIDSNNTQINNSKQLLDSVDPALVEAGKQALSLLKGQSAATLAPIQNQRAQQRQALQQTLASQLGPDYATSTAGIQALNSFDQQTSNLTTSAQQQTLQMLLGSSQSSASLGMQGLSGATSQSQSIVNTQGNLQNNQLYALSKTPIDPALGFTGQLAQNTSNSTLGSMFMNQAYTGLKNNYSSLGSLFGGGSSGSGLMAGGALDAGGAAAPAVAAIA